MLETMIGTNEICKRIGVTRTTLHNWLKSPDVGFPKPAKIGLRNFWPESVVAEFFAQARA